MKTPAKKRAAKGARPGRPVTADRLMASYILFADDVNSASQAEFEEFMNRLLSPESAGLRRFIAAAHDLIAANETEVRKNVHR